MGSNKSKSKDSVDSDNPPKLTSPNIQYMITNYGKQSVDQLNVWVNEREFPISGSLTNNLAKIQGRADHLLICKAAALFNLLTAWQTGFSETKSLAAAKHMLSLAQLHTDQALPYSLKGNCRFSTSLVLPQCGWYDNSVWTPFPVCLHLGQASKWLIWSLITLITLFKWGFCSRIFRVMS